MKYVAWRAATALVASPAFAKPVTRHPPKTAVAKKADEKQPAKEYFKPSEVRSVGTVIVGGQPINYESVAGTLVVHAKDWSDTDAVEADADTSDDKDK
jgi:hypothetical protein